MKIIFVLMQSAAMVLMVVALVMPDLKSDFEFGRPIMMIAIFFLLVGSEFLNWKYGFDDTWNNKSP